MPALSIFLDGPEGFTPIPPDATVHHTVEPMEVALLENGMQSGRASVMFRIQLADGSIVLAETSHALFDAAARAMQGRLERTAGQS